jgi:high affinity Mn2+ porin
MLMHARGVAAVLAAVPALVQASVDAVAPRFAWYAQATYVEQETDRFHAPYAGANSLVPDQGRQTADLTLYLGVRLERDTELWINPELDQGFGLTDTLGLAGFASGEAYKVGDAQPYLRWQRLFVRHTWNVGGEASEVAAAANQFASTAADERVVLTVGKFGVGDVFDVNRYAHDPRNDFLNWSIIDTGSFDYAADAWGYTVGASVEWYKGPWTWRGGFFDVSDVPNSPHLEPGFHEFQLVAEAERRYSLGDRAGKIAVTAYATHARMARLEDAIAYGAANGVPPDPAPVREFRTRHGASMNVEQALADGIGAFVRAGVSGGYVETYDFTDIDRSFAVGLAVDGKRWRRDADTLGLATVINAASSQRRSYLAAGGLGVLIGDGRLPNSSSERIVETYYRLGIGRFVHFTVDYQYVVNPAYNVERGPVSIWAVRLHMQF